jgi:hypothetical protein
MPSSPRQPLPHFLQGVSFTVAQGRSVGLGRRRMAGADLARPFYGVRAPAAWDREVPPGGFATLLPTRDPGLAQRAEALLLVLPPAAVITHLTAARLWPLPLPSGRPDEPIHVGVPVPARAPRRPGVAGHQVLDPRATVVHRGGLPVIDPATMFCQLAPLLTLHDLVAVGDALVRCPVYADDDDERPWLSRTALRHRVGLFHGRGKQAAMRAIALIRSGSESRPETLVRLALAEAGLPEPEVNVGIHDAQGRFIGRGDLVYRRWKIIVEYDGEQHRTSTRQYDRDLVRLDEFAQNGWLVIRVVGRSFFADRAGTARRVAAALMSRGWAP